MYFRSYTNWQAIQFSFRASGKMRPVIYIFYCMLNGLNSNTKENSTKYSGEKIRTTNTIRAKLKRGYSPVDKIRLSNIGSMPGQRLRR